MIIPLCVWAATGKPAAAWYALKQYLLVMSIIVVPGVAFGLITFLFQYLTN